MKICNLTTLFLAVPISMLKSFRSHCQSIQKDFRLLSRLDYDGKDKPLLQLTRLKLEFSYYL